MVLELLTRFSSPKRRSAHGLVSIPFSASDPDAPLPIVLVDEEAEEEDLGFPPPMAIHGTQHGQPRPELLIVIGKCLFQDTVDGELGRIEEALLRGSGEPSVQLLGVH